MNYDPQSRNPNFNPNSDIMVVDTETTGVDVWLNSMPFGIGLCDNDGEKWYCEWEVNPFTRTVTPNIEDWKFIAAILERKDITKVFHNAPFDFKMLRKMDFDINGRIEDSLFMARIFDNVSPDNGLKTLTTKYCKMVNDDVDVLREATIEARKIAKSMGWAISKSLYEDYWLPKKIFPAGHPWHTVCEEYCKADVYRTLMLWHFLNHMFKKEEHQYWKTTYRKEQRLFDLVMRMEERGVPISRDKCIEERELSLERREEAYKAMVDMLGYDFKPNSPKQLIDILFTHFGLKINGLSGKGDPSTRLVHLRMHSNHPFVNHLLTHRSAHKSIGTFFDNYLELMHPDPNHKNCWMLHPNINQLETRTGRFSMTHPNLQQVANPNTSTLGGRLVAARHPFGPRPGYVWLPMDFAQQELRIASDVAEIMDLKRAIKAGEDPNTTNANLAWGGRGNEAGVMAAKLALELKDPVTSKPEVQALWDHYGWDPDYERQRGGINSSRARQIAIDWLEQYDWNIVKAEGTLGKKNTRSRCKIVTFAILYGSGAENLAGQLFCPIEEARSFHALMHRTYPEIKRFSSKLQRQQQRDGYFVNPYGRRMRTEPGRDYTAVNYVIQSTAADMMKNAMLQADDVLRKSGLDAHVVLTVHDELIFEVRREHTYSWLIKALIEAMEDTQGALEVPMEIEASIVYKQWDKKIAIKNEHLTNPDTVIADLLEKKIVE